MSDKKPNDPVGVRLDIMKYIIEQLEENPRLKEILGDEPLNNIGVVSEDNDFRFYIVSRDERIPIKNAKDYECFLDVIDKVLTKTFMERK